MATNWRLKGSYFEACNCEAACPCNFHGPPTDGNCTVLVGWHIDQGIFGAYQARRTQRQHGRALAGPHVGNEVEGGPVSRQPRERRAAEALTQIFSGKAGGLMGDLSGVIGEVAGVRSVPIEYRAEGRKR